MDEQIQSYITKQKQKGYSDATINRRVQALYGVTPTASPQPESNFLLDLLPTAGSIVGGVAGGALGTTVAPGVGTVAGGVAGSAAGGALGETLRQKLTPEDDDNLGKIGEEALWGAGGELVGLGMGRLIGKGAQVLGKKTLPWAAEAVATKNLGKQAVKQFGKKAGGSLGEKLINYELVGRSSAEVAGELAKATDLYESTIKASNAPVAIYEVFDELSKKASKLLGNANPSVHAQGEALQEIAERTMNAYASNPIVTPEHILEQKRLVADVLSKTAYDEGAKKAINTIHEDVLRNVLNKAVPEAKGLGQKMRDLMEIHDIVKGAEQLQAGGRPFPLVPALFTGTGGVVGGVPGAIAGYTASSMANSPTVTQALARTLSKAAPKVAGYAPGAVASGIMGQAVVRTPKTLFGQQEQPTEQSSMTPTEAVSALTGETSSRLGGEEIKQSSVLDRLNIDEDKFLAAYLANPKNPTLAAIYEMYSAEQKTGKTKKTAEVARYEDASSQLDALGDFVQQYHSKMGPFTGRLGAVNPYDIDAQTLQAQIKAVAQIVGRAMEGGVLRKEDIPKYEAILPNIKDTPALAMKKIQNVKIILARSAKNISGAESAPIINQITQ